jgi:hypothetical protein
MPHNDNYAEQKIAFYLYPSSRLSHFFFHHLFGDDVSGFIFTPSKMRDKPNNSIAMPATMPKLLPYVLDVRNMPPVTQKIPRNMVSILSRYLTTAILFFLLLTKNKIKGANRRHPEISQISKRIPILHPFYQ